MHNGNVIPFQNTLLNVKRRKGQDVSVTSHGREVSKDLIRDGQAYGSAIIVDTNEQHTRPVVSGEIVGKRADRLPDFVAVGCGFRPLDKVGFDVIEQSLQFFVGHGRFLR